MTEFRIRVIVDPQQVASGNKRVRDELDKTENKAAGLQRTLAGAFAGIGIAALARQLVQLTDTFTNVQNRLKLVTSGQADLADTTAELFAISDRTRSSFESTAELYARLGIAAKDLGRTQAELLQFTESLNQAVLLSGASSEEARNGIIQLSQGLASGALRGDELRSVLEQLPAVADVIAKSLNVTRGELRKLGSEGKITAEVVLDAFKQARQELSDNFAQTVPTIGQSFTQLNNQILEFIGRTDQATGASAAFARVIQSGARNVDVLAASVAALAAVITSALVARAIPALIAGFASLQAAALGPLGVIAAAVAIVVVRMNTLNEQIEDMNTAFAQTELQGTLTEFGVLGNRILNAQKELARLNATFELGNRTNQAAAVQIARVQARIAALRAEQEKLRAASKRTTEQRVAASKSFVDFNRQLKEQTTLLKLDTREREVATQVLKLQDKLRKESATLTLSERQRKEVESQIRANQALKEQAKVLQEIRGPAQDRAARITALKALLDQARISQEEFNRALAAEEGAKALADTQREDQQINVALSVAGSDIDAQVEALNTLLTDGTIAATRYEEELTKLLGSSPEQQLQADLKLINAQFENGRLSVNQYRDAVAEAFIKATSDAPNLGEQIAALNMQFQQGNLSADEYARAMEKIFNLEPNQSQQAQLELLHEEFRKGTLTLDEYLDRLNRIGDEGPMKAKSLSEGFEKAITKMAERAEDFEVIANQIVNAFANRATDAILKFVETGKFSFREFASSLLKDIARIIARLLIIQALQTITGTGSGGSSSAGATAGARQKGGTVQPDRAFVVGENGPEIFEPNRTGTIVPNPADAPQQQAPVNVQVVNVENPNAVQDSLDSGDADKSFLNVVGRNREQVRKTLGL